ncbi:DUF3047 domain-containing protein [Thioalkalivibrio sp.]|uniref:DUF3047 domain-containing protein n=2 Tax=Thioalkalivibrio sp. TaxID=2093813 RepID=UPI003567E691
MDKAHMARTDNPASARLLPTASATLTALAALALSAAVPAAPVFGPEDIIGWEPHSFEGVTDYRLVRTHGRTAVQATCTEGTASGLFYRRDIDLTETPVVEWEWRVEETLTGIDETTRDGDDYPARLYLVDESRLLRWRTRALNYVWSSTTERGRDWPNAFASQAHMIAVATGSDAGAGWRTERRNVLEDFRRYHGHEPGRINAVAVMTDCDNTGQETRAWYGNIRFLPE